MSQVAHRALPSISINKHLVVITDTYEILNASKPLANNLGHLDIATIAPNLNF